MAAQWIWIYGIRPKERTEIWGEPRTESRWLSWESRLTPAERDSRLQGHVAVTTTLWGKSAPYFTHLWWAAWDERTDSFEPWVRYLPQ